MACNKRSPPRNEHVDARARRSKGHPISTRVRTGVPLAAGKAAGAELENENTQLIDFASPLDGRREVLKLRLN